MNRIPIAATANTSSAICINTCKARQCTVSPIRCQLPYASVQRSCSAIQIHIQWTICKLATTRWESFQYWKRHEALMQPL